LSLESGAQFDFLIKGKILGRISKVKGEKGRARKGGDKGEARRGVLNGGEERGISRGCF
jgi:hypothetical protein